MNILTLFVGIFSMNGIWINKDLGNQQFYQDILAI